MMRRAALAMAFVFVATTVWAQGATPASLAKVTVSNDVAKRTLMKMQINAETARAIVDACLEFGRNQQGGPGTYAIYVLAPNGDIVDAHVMDGVLPIGAETGLMKAKTALYARTSSSAVAQRFGTVDGRLIRLDLGKEKGLAYYFVGGGNMDEMCAYTALTKVLGPQPPLTPAAPPAGGGGGRAGRGQ